MSDRNSYMSNDTQLLNKEFRMSKNEGLFSQSLKSLEIQLKTLFYGSGNENSIAFLDSLSHLGILEQEMVLKQFTGIVERILNGDKRFLSPIDIEQKKIEEELYQEIVSGMTAAAKIPNLEGKRLAVLEGGKNPHKNKQLIDLSQVRKNRKNPLKPVLN